VQQQVELRKIIRTSYNEVQAMLPTSQRKLIIRAWPALEPLLIVDKLVSPQINIEIENVLKRPAINESDFLTERDFDNLITCFLGKIKQKTDNTSLADTFNRVQADELWEQISDIKQRLNNVENSILGLRKSIDNISSEQFLNAGNDDDFKKSVTLKAKENSILYYKSLTEYEFSRFAHIKYDQRLFSLTSKIEMKYASVDDQDRYTIEECVARTQNNIVFIGERGMGKTTSLLKIWSTLLEQNQVVPIYVPLNEANQYNGKGFINNFISAKYKVKLENINSGNIPNFV